MIELRENERIDDLQFKGLRIIQNTKGFCFGSDSVLLANFATVKKNELVVDLGTGTGIIPILLAGKTPAKKIVGIEIQEIMVDMARRSIKLNNLEDKIEIVKGDLKEANKILGYEGFDVVTANPPYMKGNSGFKNATDLKTISRHEILCTLEDVIKSTFSLLKYGGRLYMVHRAERLADVVYNLKLYKLEPKKLQVVYPSREKEASLILIEAVKGANSALKILDPLLLNEKE